MPTMKEAASEFLANKRIAVTGVSRTPKDHGANTVFKRLRDRGYEVFPVNPNDKVEGAHQLPRPEEHPRRRRRRRDRHRPRQRRKHDARVRRARHQAGLDAPLLRRRQRQRHRHRLRRLRHHRDRRRMPSMFEPTADFGHKVMRVIYRGHVPKTV